jgi:putative membrane protein
VIRFLVRTVILLIANAIGLIVAAVSLDGMNLNATGFIVAVAVFTVAAALMQPFFASLLMRRGSSALGGVALIATLASLIITVLVTDGMTIDGVGTWVAAAVIVWAAALVAALILPLFGAKKYLEANRN